MNGPAPNTSDTVVPFAPFARNAPPQNDDPLDNTGQNILGLLQQAAIMAQEDSQHALGVAHKLSLQLRSAEDRIKDLEADVRHYRERADRAEKWLHKISLEIEERFFAQAESRPAQPPTRPTGPLDYARRK
jgi:hypothetical protein